MPTVLNQDGYRFFFFSNENGEPPHIHVSHGDAYAKVWLRPARFAYAKRLTPSQMRRVRELTEEHEDEFHDAYTRYFA